MAIWLIPSRPDILSWLLAATAFLIVALVGVIPSTVASEADRLRHNR